MYSEKSLSFGYVLNIFLKFGNFESIFLFKEKRVYSLTFILAFLFYSDINLKKAGVASRNIKLKLKNNSTSYWFLLKST